MYTIDSDARVRLRDRRPLQAGRKIKSACCSSSSLHRSTNGSNCASLTQCNQLTVLAAVLQRARSLYPQVGTVKAEEVVVPLVCQNPDGVARCSEMETVISHQGKAAAQELTAQQSVAEFQGLVHKLQVVQTCSEIYLPYCAAVRLLR